MNQEQHQELRERAAMSSELLELAAKVERATGPDRELDRAIWYALSEIGQQHHGDPVHGPTCTASLDAAMTLWPGEVPHLIPSDPRICTAMALRARAQSHEEKK